MICLSRVSSDAANVLYVGISHMLKLCRCLSAPGTGIAVDEQWCGLVLCYGCHRIHMLHMIALSIETCR